MKAYIPQENVTTLLSFVCIDPRACGPLSLSNTDMVKGVYEASEKGVNKKLLFIHFSLNDEIVHEGVVINSIFNEDSSFEYSKVPLGFILKGEVVVQKGGKATKKLGEGDFIGLFETSDWIETGKTREIGDWTLVATKDTDILFFGKEWFDRGNERGERFCSYLVDLARHDIVPQPITSLPLLDWVASHTTQSRLKDTAIIAHTHLLPNNFPFFRHLAHLVDFGHMYVLEKPYSTIRSVMHELIRSGCDVTPVHIEEGMEYEFAIQKSLAVMWRKIIEDYKKGEFKQLLIVDDGGDLWLSIPWNELEGIRIAGVEQTQRGVTRLKNSNAIIPLIVSVASSGIKKLVEAKFIGQAVVERLREGGVLDSVQKIGIIGMGSIGMSIFEQLEACNKEVFFYDNSYISNPKLDAQYLSSLDSLINKTDLIIGTTGIDVLKGIAFDRIKGEKILVSASSADIEFLSLLKIVESTKSPFGIREVKVHENLTFKILNGGYPYNFDRVVEREASEDIVLTRCLMYIGTMQAVRIVKKEDTQRGFCNLDPISQEKLLRRWLEEKMKLGQGIDIDENGIDKIISYSGLQDGIYMESVWEE